MEASLNLARILSFITPWALPTSLLVLVIGAILDILKKRFHWSKFALIFLVIAIILTIIQINLVYSLTGDILNNP